MLAENTSLTNLELDRNSLGEGASSIAAVLKRVSRHPQFSIQGLHLWESSKALGLPDAARCTFRLAKALAEPVSESHCHARRVSVKDRNRRGEGKEVDGAEVVEGQVKEGKALRRQIRKCEDGRQAVSE